MGGRGVSLGVSVKGKKYGSEYKTILKHGNIKFVKARDAESNKAPQETMTRGRVYVYVNSDRELKSIVYFDNSNKRNKTIDLSHDHRKMRPHVHHGYNHNEYDGSKGATKPNTKERRMVEKVKKIWYNYINKNR